jgi:phosphopantetheinyl transferase
VSESALRVAFSVWPHDALATQLDACDVLVCSASLAADRDAVTQALTVLDLAERERFERYENADVARRFAISRLRLREMLAVLLGVAPVAVPIQIGLHGKPALARAAQSSGIRFSVAHCDELVLVALTRIGDVGIDVERVRPIERWARVADRVFGPGDRAAIGREIAGGDEPTSVFFRFWPRRPASRTSAPAHPRRAPCTHRIGRGRSRSACRSAPDLPAGRTGAGCRGRPTRPPGSSRSP